MDAPSDSPAVDALAFIQQSLENAWNPHSCRMVLPWQDESEWECFCEAMISSCTRDRSKACAMVAWWQSRSSALPLGLDALCDIRWTLDQLDCTKRQAMNHDAVERGLRYQLALILARWVSAMTDRLQQKSKYARSVSTLADRLQLPPLLVEIRHLSIHNELPSLPVLELASKHALSYLHQHYVVDRRRALEHRIASVRAWVRALSRRSVEDHADEGRHQEYDHRGRSRLDWASGRLEMPSLPVLGYVEARWLAREIAWSMASSIERNSKATENNHYRLSCGGVWPGLIRAIHQQWPHALPTMVFTWVHLTGMVNDDIAADPGINASMAALVLDVCSDCLGAAHVIEYDRTLCFSNAQLWVSWLKHSLLSCSHMDLSQWCDTWLENRSVSGTLNSRGENHDVTWHKARIPEWQPCLVAMRGAWSRCAEWPMCPIGALPIGYRIMEPSVQCTDHHDEEKQSNIPSPLALSDETNRMIRRSQAILSASCRSSSISPKYQ